MSATSIHDLIFNRLRADSSINTAVNGKVLAAFRDDFVPSIAFDISIEEVNQRYEGSGPIQYELIISVVAETLAEANEIAEFVIDDLDYSSWTDSPYVVLGCFLRDRDADTEGLTSKDKRLAVVDLRFEMTVKETS